ncbi:hypothetical protein PORY_002847 [Pneumocystis oryctolagi]|uniref:Uncharacterized protein n=1 Tax=Pneumocystis oryctolagi TaxID=42067 RepID=A0ACB7C7W0_9ASCO|nr:hypothetical protein PORY_002847 [Pneumocystis oryctolagi]
MKALFVSSPGKVILFGEHAVVYGKAAIAASISLRTYLMIFSDESEESIVRIKFPDIDLDKSWRQEDFPWDKFLLQDPLSPPLEINKVQISCLVDFVKDEPLLYSRIIQAFLYLYMNLSKYDKTKSITFILRSEIPIGSGLGSSASMSVCLAAGLLLFNGHINPPDGTRLDKEVLFMINSWAFNGEMCIHGNPSGIDNTISSRGNALFFRKTNTSSVFETLHNFPTLPLLLINTLQPRSTLDMVNSVKSFYQNYKDIVSCIFDTIDHISMNFKLLYEEGLKSGKCSLNRSQVGTLMRINHDLLCALGVGHEKFTKIVKIANDCNIGWTKLTGAGGGGCVMVLLREELNDRDIHAFEVELMSNGFEVYKVILGDKGVGILNCDDCCFRKYMEIENRKQFMDFLESIKTMCWKYWLFKKMDNLNSWELELKEILNFDCEGVLEPTFQDDSINPIASIAYPPNYSEAMAYLKTIMIKEEMSERAMKLTAYLINMNPAHYTVWAYRMKVLINLKKDIFQELLWIEQLSKLHPKSYQLWHHRQLLIDIYGDPSMELNFLNQILEKDSKNYHAWSYRQWLTKRFNLWDIELSCIDFFLKKDIRNNSAWNHRFYVVFRENQYVTDDLLKKEIEYCKNAIAFSPQNPSPWLYLRGIFEKYNLDISLLESFCLQYASLDPKEDQKMSSEALEFLADIYSLNEIFRENAKKALQLLISKYDTIRKCYWKYKISLLDKKK